MSAIDALLLQPDGPGTGSRGVLVLHSWWGLSDDVRATCRALADAGFTALAPDLFGGERPADADEARAALLGLDPSTLTREVVAAAGALQDATGAKLAPIGVVGFGMGGSLALWLACRMPGVVGAAVTYYGTQHLDFAPLRAAVLGHFAEDDDEVSEDDRSYAEALLGLAGHEPVFLVHPGTRHGFAEPGDPAHDAVAASAAWERTVDHLRAALTVTVTDATWQDGGPRVPETPMAIVHRSPLPDIDIPETALTPYVLRYAAERATTPALVDGPTGRTTTFGELADLVARLAGGFAARGIGRGGVVGLMAPNVPEYALVFHAVATAGGTVTTVNPTYRAEEVRFQLQDAGATVLVTVPPFLATAAEAIEGTAVTDLLVIGDADGATPLTAWLGDPIGQQPVDPVEDVVVLPYSSGTTGLPKGVMLTHHNLVANLAQVEAMIRFDEGEAILSVLPFFHIYGMQVLMNGALAQGVGVVTMPRFDLEQALTLIQERRITRFFAVPPIVLALAKHPLVDRFDLSSLRQVFSGAAPLGAELAEEAAARIGCEVVQGYGMTELSPVSHATPAGGYRPGSVGVLVPNTESRIVDEQGTDRGVGEEGELWVRGPLVMKGYLNNPEATAATIDADGWLHTGDVARIDPDGHTYIVDRVKELIKYKGFQVPPAELEALLLTHPGIADVAVVGIPDVEAGELPKAFVVRKPGAEVGAEEIQAFVAGHLATYKQVRIVQFVDEIPKSASGKILRRLLRDA